MPPRRRPNKNTGKQQQFLTRYTGDNNKNTDRKKRQQQQQLQYPAPNTSEGIVFFGNNTGGPTRQIGISPGGIGVDIPANISFVTDGSQLVDFHNFDISMQKFEQLTSNIHDNRKNEDDLPLPPRRKRARITAPLAAAAAPSQPPKKEIENYYLEEEEAEKDFDPIKYYRDSNGPEVHKKKSASYLICCFAQLGIGRA